MKVEVRLFATLRAYVPGLGVGEAKIVELPPGATFTQLMETLGIAPAEVKIIMRNGRQVEPDDTIHDGDRIALIPAVGGG